jgi:hypothetical protein
MFVLICTCFGVGADFYSDTVGFGFDIVGSGIAVCLYSGIVDYFDTVDFDTAGFDIVDFGIVDSDIVDSDIVDSDIVGVGIGFHCL